MADAPLHHGLGLPHLLPRLRWHPPFRTFIVTAKSTVLSQLVNHSYAFVFLSHHALPLLGRVPPQTMTQPGRSVAVHLLQARYSPMARHTNPPVIQRLSGYCAHLHSPILSLGNAAPPIPAYSTPHTGAHESIRLPFATQEADICGLPGRIHSCETRPRQLFPGTAAMRACISRVRCGTHPEGPPSLAWFESSMPDLPVARKVKALTYFPYSSEHKK